MFLQLYIDDEVLSGESDDNEDMEPAAKANSSQDGELDDEAPATSSNTRAVVMIRSVVTLSAESFEGYRIGVQNNAFRVYRSP
ncbi:hypothetical protein KIN20_033385 [Parelaphostrongylus tenuis]|uniref:Uncharacterized protein n=1 Tax=Parelaphostrongylus tenuis TaxID=148309 RepID=A0AAD5R8G7_PARTN|nr:hypothetical protein KIN20_020434 [Parelaphostrongylus tenuis]KAJ1371431.1 hypothetical protein KIN20_033385 [Parelaphostrongylus tenuis]